MYFKKVNARSVLNTGFIYVVYVNLLYAIERNGFKRRLDRKCFNCLRNCGSKSVLKQEQQLAMTTFL